MSIIILSLAWLLGTFLGQCLHPGQIFILFGLLPLTVILIFRRNLDQKLILGLFCLFCFISAAALVKPFSPTTGESLLRTYNGIGPVEIKGMINRDPESSSTQSRLYLSSSTILVDGHWTDISGDALLFVPTYPEYRYGEQILVAGLLEDPFSLNNEEYTAYLARQGVFSVIDYPEITVTGYGGSVFFRWLHSTRNALNRILTRILSEPQAALAQGIVLGIRSNIPADLKQAFSQTGTTHILAISGFNLTIIAGILSSWTLRLFGRRYHIHIWITAIIIFLYSCLTGLQPPVVRAAIMVGCFLAADFFGRQKSGIIALFLTAVIMTAIDAGLIFDASTQMSFLAMAGLIFVTPLFEQAGQHIIERVTPENRSRSLLKGCIDSYSASLGAMITTWPLVAYYFDIFSGIGPIATFLALPVMPAIIIISILASIVGLIALPIAQVTGWVVWLPLSYLVIVVTSLAQLHGVVINTNGLSFQFIFIYYSILTVILFSVYKYQWLLHIISSLRPYLSRLSIKWTTVSLIVIALFVWIFALSMPDRNVHVSFLNVGQGDAILIEKGTQQILVDGGPDPQATVLALSKKIPFWDRHIDMVVLTHPDSDHLGGLVEVLNRNRIMYIFSDNLSNDAPLYQEWLNTIAEKQIRSFTACAGQNINIGDEVQISVLNPLDSVISQEYTDMNDRSVVLRLQFGKISFLLTGDLTINAEKELIRNRANLRSTILKVGHHGSASSTSEEFLNVVAPDMAIISVGRNNHYGHPNPQVYQRLLQRLDDDHIFRTDRDGTVEFITDGEKLWIKTDK